MHEKGKTAVSNKTAGVSQFDVSVVATLICSMRGGNAPKICETRNARSEKLNAGRILTPFRAKSILFSEFDKRWKVLTVINNTDCGRVRPFDPYNRRRPRDAMPRAYLNRPYAIRRAIRCVWENAITLGFTQSVVKVLQAILAAGVSAQEPFAPVFAKKTTLAHMAGCSEVSVYRAMRQLETAGWIARVEQPRRECGTMSIGLISITRKLAELIGFSETEKNNNSVLVDSNVLYDEEIKTENNCSLTTVNNSKHEKNNPDARAGDWVGVYDVRLLRKHASPDVLNADNQPLRPGMTDEMIDGPIYRINQACKQKASGKHQSAQNGEYVRMEGRSVARELVWLITEKRLSYGGLFLLQTLASKVPGQRLSDFVALRAERIRELKSSADCFRYLKKLIAEGIDARFMNAQKQRKTHLEHRNRQRAAASKTRLDWANAHHGMSFMHPATGKCYRINAKHGCLECFHADWPSVSQVVPFDGRFIAAVRQGRLLPFTPTGACSLPSSGAVTMTAQCRENGRKHLDKILEKFHWLKKRREGNAEVSVLDNGFGYVAKCLTASKVHGE